MEPKITERKSRVFAGLEYYGPLEGDGWSRENTIGHLWSRWTKFMKKYSHLIQDIIVDPKVGYELTAWNEDEFLKTKRFYIFVGVEIKEGNIPLPLQLVKRMTPGGLFAEFTAKGKEITNWENLFYKDWLPKSEFQLADFNDYSYQVQAYEDNRFKGVSEDSLNDSEVDVVIPIIPRN
jgi:hypothetical protein